MGEEPSRKEIWKMFDQISPTYDKVNRVMTFGIDVYWRKKLCQFLPKTPSLHVLDCATGTGDQIISLMQNGENISTIVGIDLAEEMLKIGEEKLKNFPFASKVSLVNAGMENLPFPDGVFDCVTISFGIRNAVNVPLCLKEIHRVLKKGGRLLILEGSLPSNWLIRGFHLFYLRHLLPRIGFWISKNKHAYVYLNKTIETFPSGKAFCNLLDEAGYISLVPTPLTGGSVTIYQGDKA